MATIEDQIQEIEDEIQRTPYNKATQRHIGRLKAKLSRLREELQARRAKAAGGGPGYAVRKSGHATVGLIGFPSVGKSTLLNRITDARSEVAAYAFTTIGVIPGLLEYRGAKIQVLDMPGLISGASRGRGRGREVLAVARTLDLVLLMIDVFETNVDVLAEELRMAGIRLNERPPSVVITKTKRGGVTANATVSLTHMDLDTVQDMVREWFVNAEVVVREDITPDQLVDVLVENRVYTPALVTVNKIDLVTSEFLDGLRGRLRGWDVLPISARTGKGIEALKSAVYGRLRFIRVYLKPQGKEADLAEPLIIHEGSTVGDVCDSLHRDFRRKFRYANVWGPSAAFPGQKVGVHHDLRDRDVLTVVIRKR